MSEINVTNLNAAVVERNYAAEFFKNKGNIEYSTIFNKLSEDQLGKYTESVSQTKKEIKSLVNKLVSTQDKLQLIYAQRYRVNYTPIQTVTYLKYHNRQTRKYSFYDMNGQLVDDEINEKDSSLNIINIDCKNGEIYLLSGYSYDFGGMIVTSYKYSIGTKGTTITLIPIDEVFVSFFDDITVNTFGEVKTFYNTGAIGEVLRNSKGDEFINNFFKTNIKTGYNLQELRTYYRINKSFETFVKTITDNELLKCVLPCKVNECMSIQKFLGVTKETYDRAINEGIGVALFRFKDQIANKQLFNKNEEGWLNLIHTCRDYVKGLTFYNISVRYNYQTNNKQDELLEEMCSVYKNNSEFNQNYSIKGLIDYVVAETIDQGYNRIYDYCNELRDYIRACDLYGCKPALHTSYLKIAHDVVVRNHQINVTPEQESEFKSRYKDFKDFTYKDFIIRAPRETKEIQAEGDSLSHCVGTYIYKIIQGESFVVFLRLKDTPDESLITIEIKDGQITQAEGASRRNPQEKEIEALKAFAEDRDLELAY